jgi:hypothetical protein
VALATLDNRVAVDGLVEAEAGQMLLAALEPQARPHSAEAPAVVASGGPMPWPRLARRALEGGRLPRAVGSAPSCWCWWTWTACRAAPAWVATPMGPVGS